MLRKIAREADRRVLTSAAVTASAIAVLATVGLTIENEPPTADPQIAHLAESSSSTSTSVPTVTETPPGTTPPAPPTSETADPGAAHIVPATIPDGPLGIPGIALDAYHRASDRLDAERPACEIDWTVLAGIGQVESNQGRGKFDVHGNTIGRIVGPRLDGSLEGTAVIKDTDGGRFDGDADFDRAVGPVQFIPSTWAALGRDGNDDGVADPNNIYDGALAAATLLCSQGGSMGDPAARTRAILAYNNSLAYVANVNAWAHGYAVNSYPLPSDLPDIHQPKPTVEPPKPPEHCPEGWEGEPTAAAETAQPGAPEPAVPGCTEPAPQAPDSGAPMPSAPAPAETTPVAPAAPAPPPPPPLGLPVFELPCIAPFCVPPPA